MQASTTVFKVFYFSIVFFEFVSLKRFDIESECLKLYKEDLKTVLARFRRTPDYLKILQEKENDLKAHLTDMNQMTLFYYMNKLTKEVTEKFAPTKTTETTTITDSTPPGYLMRRDNDASADVNETTTLSNVQLLDTYDKLVPKLTLQERNAIKDMAYDYTGHYIHSVINHLGPDDSPGKSTQLAGEEDGKKKPTTKHVHSAHQIETTTEKTTTEHIHDVSELRAGSRNFRSEKTNNSVTGPTVTFYTPLSGY